MQWLRPLIRAFLVTALGMLVAFVFSGSFSISYPGIAYAQGTPAAVAAPAVGTTGFFVMTSMLAVTILMMFMFSRRLRKSPQS